MKQEIKMLIQRIVDVYWTLIKIMVPALIVVKILESIGATHYLSIVLSPLMNLVGLPESMGLVWAASMLVNLYTGMAVFFSIALAEPLTVAQISVLSTMMLISHGLPVESAISKAAGLSWTYTLTLRIVGALVLGFILHWIYSTFSLLEEPSRILWQPEKQDDSLLGWVILQAQTLILALVIIAVLIVIMRLLEYLGIEKWLHWMLSPFLKLLGIGKEAANITVIGVTLGLSFGGGLLIEQAKSGAVSKRNIFLSMSFLCLCHSLIEDTLLMLLLGADLTSILWVRLLFAFIVVAFIARITLLGKEKTA